MRTLARLVPFALLAACARPDAQAAAAGAPDTATAAATAPPPPAAPAADTGAEPLTFRSSLAKFELRIPPVWGRRFSVSERSEPAEYPRATHVVEFLYLPRESSSPPTILGVVAYDAAGWGAVKGGAQAPRGGEVITEQGGRVFVAVRQPNPFPTGGADAAAFDSLQVPTDRVKAAFKPL